MFNDTPIYEFRGPWGVPVQLGSSILLLPLIFVSFNATPQELVYDLMFLGMLVGSIFLHELGHAWGALIQGVPVRRIMLYGGGGFCERVRSASAWQDELIVAMGPIVNLTLWAGAGLIAPTMPEGDIRWAVETLGWLNFWLAAFNMVPVMPLDGGRLFHLLMLRVLPSVTAIRVAGAVGLVCAVAWIPAMLGSFLMFGFLLFFMPSIFLHWRMLTGRIA